MKDFAKGLCVKWWNLRIHQRMLLSYSLAVIVPIAMINAWTFMTTRSFTLNTASDNIDVILSKGNSVLNAQFVSLYERAVAISNTQELVRLFSDTKVPVQDDGIPTLEISTMLTALDRIYSTSPGYYFKFYAKRKDLSYYSGNVIILNSEPYMQQSWYQRATDFGYGVYWRDVHEDPDFGANRRFVTACRAIYDEQDGSVLGVATVSLDFAWIEEVFVGLLESNRGAVYLFDADESLIYSKASSVNFDGKQSEGVAALSVPEQSAIFQHSFGKGIFGKNILYNYITVDQFMWKLVIVVPQEQFLGEMNNIFHFLLPVLIGTVALFLVVTYFISQSLSKPIKVLAKTMRGLGEDGFEKSYLAREDEIGELANAYARMVKSNKKLLLETMEMDEKRRRYQLEALQGQINSHFIYNTLSNIQWLAAAGLTEAVISTATALDKMLRVCVKNQSELVSIEDELDYVDSYLSIQKIRFKNRFEYTFELNDFAMQMRIPMFILQPIVENSIYHGLLDKAGDDGLIRIQVDIRDNTIMIRVIDNGKGIPSQNLSKVLLEDHQDDDLIMGIALKNINKRIKITCGEEYGLSIDSKLGEWTCTTIKLPLVED